MTGDEEPKLQVEHVRPAGITALSKHPSVIKARGHDENHGGNIWDKNLSPGTAIKSWQVQFNYDGVGLE